MSKAKNPRWQSEKPTPGRWWVAFHPSKRAPGTAEPVLGCIVSPMEVAKGEHENAEWFPLEDERFIGALWLRRDAPHDPFKCPRHCSECDGSHHRLPNSDECKHCDMVLPPEEL